MSSAFIGCGGHAGYLTLFAQSHSQPTLRIVSVQALIVPDGGTTERHLSRRTVDFRNRSQHYKQPVGQNDDYSPWTYSQHILNPDMVEKEVIAPGAR
jgi:hypothetical protein